ncbi:MAG: hypothetical protein WC244_03090 [Patescibacteria group bacterium]|jgi:hypothetical protein
MDNLEKTITGRYQKIIMGVTIGALLIAGLLLFLWRYSSVLGSMSQQVVKNPLQQNAVSMAQIKADYEINFFRIIGNYLKADPAASDFGSLTTQAKDQILALRVPEKSEEFLSAVLILSNIESALAKGDSVTVALKLSELKKLNQGFSPVQDN